MPVEDVTSDEYQAESLNLDENHDKVQEEEEYRVEALEKQNLDLRKRLTSLTNEVKVCDHEIILLRQRIAHISGGNFDAEAEPDLSSSTLQRITSDGIDIATDQNQKQTTVRSTPRRISDIKGLLSTSPVETGLFTDISDNECNNDNINDSVNLYDSSGDENDDTDSYSASTETNLREKYEKRKSKGRVDEDAIEAELRQYEYQAFLAKMRSHICNDLVKSIKLFLAGVKLEHESKNRPGGSGGVVSVRRIVDFFTIMENAIISHAAWDNASDEEISAAREGVEKYVMTRIYRFTFAVDKEELSQDRALTTKMNLLEMFVNPDHLEVPQACRNELVLELAQEELRRINLYRAPVDKIDCIVRASSIIFNVLGLSRKASGADDFFPAFLYVVLKARVKNLWCNIEYISKYRNPADLMSKAGYCFINLRSAATFYLNLEDSAALNMTEEEFLNNMKTDQESLSRDEERC